MSRVTRIVLLGVVAALWPVAAWAQYPSELVGFNGPPIDPIPEDIPTCMEMFRTPQVSGSTDRYILLNEPNQPYANNAAFRASGLQTEGEAAMRVYFRWVDPADPQGWLRLTTWDGPERPNPALHTQGKVRFKLINRSEFFQGEIGICIGIRETGQVVPQMTDGGASGDIEWVGVTGVGPDPNNPVPIPAVTLPVSPNPDIPYELEWDLSTGVVYLDGDSQGGGIAAFTGDGILNAPNNRGTLEHIAFTNVTSDPAVFIDVAIDELQFEAPEPDPVVPPTVVWPIIAGDMQVTVTDLQTGVDQVNLLLDGAPYLSEDVTTPDDVIFTLPAAAETGQAYSATQRVNGILSEESARVIVLPEPPAYTFSLLVDENGDGSCDTFWEWVGVTDVEVLNNKWAPQGQPLFTSDGVWQTIDVPLDDDSLVLPSIGGNGMLDPSPSGFYTIDSIWFTLGEEAGLGPWEVLVDAVQYLDESGQVGETILDMEDGVNRLRYARGQSPDELGLISSGHTQVSSYDGQTAHRLEWEYDGEPLESIGILQRIGYTCGTSALIPDTATAVRFHLVLRGQPTAPDIDLPEVVGPIIVGTQDTVRILNDETATSVQLYLNGEAEGSPAAPTGNYTDFGDLTLTPGDSVSATQTLPAGTSDLAYPRVVLDAPPPPTVVAPIFPGDTTVTVTDLLVVPHATAEYVVVYADGDWVGFQPAGTETVVVTITEGGPLEEGQVITATQYVNGVESGFSEPVVVGIPGPTLYKAPAEGDTVVTVLGVHPDASLLTVWVNGGASSFEVDPGGNTTVDVPVSGLVMGDTVTAWMTVDGNPSGESDYETVTTNTTVEIVCDDFEYEQADYEAAWGDAGYARLELVDITNATPGGQKSLYAPEGDSRVDVEIAPLIPTETEPVIVNFDVYDEIGVGNLAVQFVQLTGDLVSGDWFLLESGILGWANTDNVHYDLRIHGNGGMDWLDLDEFDAPDRSVGWHNITVVHKGTRIDAYVDGLLALKNSPMTDQTTYEFARIGAAPYSERNAYFDDYCVEVGPVRFGEVPPSPAIAAPIEDGDQVVTVTGARQDVTLVQIRDEDANVIGSYAGVMDPNGVDVPLTRPLAHLESITARMTAPGWDVTSFPLEVGQGNGDVLICIGVRETGDTDPLGSEGSTSADFDIEWIGAASVVNEAPQGVAISPSDSWQTVTFDPLTDPILGFTGDGSITATRGTLEHLAVAVNAASPDRSTGAYELYVDNVVNVGAGSGGSDFVITDFEGYDVGTEVLFQEPTYTDTTDQHLTWRPCASEVSDAHGNPGQSELLVWLWKDTTAQRWVRITTASATTEVPRLEVPSPIIDLTKPIRMDLLLVEVEAIPGDVDGDGDVDLTDLALLLSAYGSHTGDPDYNPNADFDQDGDVDLTDLATLLSHYGEGT